MAGSGVAMSARTYLETTIVSYLTAWPSRDLVLAAHQQVTRDWWATRGSCELFISQFVLDEAAAGDAAAAAQRLEAIRDATLLDVTEDAILLAGGFAAESPIGCASRRHGDCPRDGLPDHVELQAHRKRRNAPHHRGPVPSCRLRTARHLHATRAPEGLAMMPTDMIVEEIHAIREALSQASEDDIRKIAEAARARQVQSGRKAERLAPRKARPVRKAS